MLLQMQGFFKNKSGQRWAQKAGVAARAPPPPAGRARGRRGSKRGRRDLWEKVIQTRRSQHSRPDQSKTWTSTPFPRGGLLSALILPSLIPLQPPLLLLTEVRWEPRSMFHRNYLTDGPDFASGTDLMRRNHGWVSTIQFYGSLVLCSILCSISGTCRLVCFTSCFRLSAVMTSLVDTRARLGWDPWIVWPSRRFLWEPPWSSGLQHCNSRTCGSFYYQFLAGDASYWGRCTAIWGYLCASSGTAPLPGFFK